MTNGVTPAIAGIPDKYRTSDGNIDVARLKADVSIVSIAAEFTDLRKSGDEQVGLCPLHNESTASFHVNEGKGLYHCFGCGIGGDVIDLFSRLHHADFTNSCAGIVDAAPRQTLGKSEAQKSADRTLARRRAREEWHAARPIEGTPAETYLLSRGVGSNVPGSLRFSHVPRFWHDDGREGPRRPAMIAAVQDDSGGVTGIHRTFIDRDGRRVRTGQPRLALGRIRGCAIRLGPVAPRIMLASGIEDGLALRLMFPGASVWVAPGDANLAHVRFPWSIEHVTVCGDEDPSGRAAVAAAHIAFARRGIETDELFSKAGKDFNEEWLLLHA